MVGARLRRAHCLLPLQVNLSVRHPSNHSMPSAWTHAMSAIAVGALVLPAAPPRVWSILAIGAVLPDVDAIGRPFGYGDLASLGGHRALTHSLTAAVVLGVVVSALAWRTTPAPACRARFGIAFALAFATHGLLDAWTTYGQGVTFFAPWSWQRFRFPWAPLRGLASDSVLFLCAALVARSVIQRRGWPLPPWLALPRRTPVA